MEFRVHLTEASQFQVYLYDLSQGAAKELSPGLLGRALEGVWHSAVVVYGREYSFTKAGVISVIPVSDEMMECLDLTF